MANFNAIGCSVSDLGLFLAISFGSDGIDNQYKDFTYDASDNLTRIDIFTDATKTKKLFTKVFTYDASGNLTKLVTTEISSGSILTKTFTYDASDNLTNLDVRFS